MRALRSYIRLMLESMYQSHTQEPKEGDRVVNVNENCKHFGSEGIVLSVQDIPKDSGRMADYRCTNSGSTWSEGDVLSKTLDQLAPLPNPAGRGYIVRRR